MPTDDQTVTAQAPRPPDAPPPDARRLRSGFERDGQPSFGAEEEVMLLDPQTLDLAEIAARALGPGDQDERLKLELPAAHLEIASPVVGSLDQLAAELGRGRQLLAERVGAQALLAAAGTHPFAAAEGALNRGSRYDRIEREYGSVARRQLICGLHVHVALAGPQRALAVYNALRSYLPEIAALAANAPFHDGRDTGMASVRPLIAGSLPRQGVPPVVASFEHYAAALRWAWSAGRLASPREWWWELRLHPELGTLELRVPDAQTSVAAAAAVATVAASAAIWLGEAHDAGQLPEPAEGWRIAENRWAAARHGLDARLADLGTGRPVPARERLNALLDELEPVAARLGGAAAMRDARGLVIANGAVRQRAVAAERGPLEMVRWLTGSFLPVPPGR